MSIRTLPAVKAIVITTKYIIPKQDNPIVFPILALVSILRILYLSKIAKIIEHTYAIMTHISYKMIKTKSKVDLCGLLIIKKTKNPIKMNELKNVYNTGHDGIKPIIQAMRDILNNSIIM